MKDQSPQRPREVRPARPWFILVAIAGAALLVTFWACSDSWGIIATHGEFRLVESNGVFYAFDRGERPEIDGFIFVDPAKAARTREGWMMYGVRSVAMDRNSIPVTRSPPPRSYSVTFGSVRKSAYVYRMPVIRWTVPWLVEVECDIHLHPKHVVEVDFSERTSEMHASELPPALPVISEYLDRNYPSAGLGKSILAGARKTIEFRREAWYVCLVELLLLLCALASLWRGTRALVRRPPPVPVK